MGAHLVLEFRAMSLGFLSFPNSFSSLEIHPFSVPRVDVMAGSAAALRAFCELCRPKLGWDWVTSLSNPEARTLGNLPCQGSFSEWDVSTFYCRISWNSTGWLDCFWNHHFFHHARKEYHLKQFDWGEVIDIISDTVHKRDPPEVTMRQSMTTVDTITVWGVNINPPGVSYGKIKRKTCTKKKQHPKHISSERKTRTSRYELSLMRFPVFWQSKWKTTLAIVFRLGM